MRQAQSAKSLAETEFRTMATTSSDRNRLTVAVVWIHEV